MASSLGADRVPPIRAIQAIGITSAAILGGMNITLSFFSIPACLLAPTPVALKQFAQIYNLGKKVGPGGSLLCVPTLPYQPDINTSSHDGQCTPPYEMKY